MTGAAVAAGVAALLLSTMSVAAAEEANIPVTLIDEGGIGASIGTITASDGPDGLQLKPQLTGLPPGLHGFHVHENGDCGSREKDGKMVAGLAAGGHWDPDGTGHHEGPAGKGHKGDLPPLAVNADGSATTAVVAARLKVADLKGKALIIHAGGDNFSDQPAPLGGGGSRIACGIAR